MRVNLRLGDIELELDPIAGGSVSRLRYRGLDILRQAPQRSGSDFDAREYAAFPMVPFVGRIHQGRFIADGREHKLPSNMPPEPHAIHGHGWQAQWLLTDKTTASVALLYSHTANDWPWSYDAKQTFTLSPDGLDLEMSVTNRSASPMPVGFGWHPYFYRDQATLEVPTTRVWCPDEETGQSILAAISPEMDLSTARSVESMLLDTSYPVSAGTINLRWPTHSVQLQSDPLFEHATVYIPKGEDYFCVEPISHAPNAINSSLPRDITGLRYVNPGETLCGTIRLRLLA